MVLNLGSCPVLKQGQALRKTMLPVSVRSVGFFLIEWAEMDNGKQSALPFDCYLC